MKRSSFFKTLLAVVASPKLLSEVNWTKPIASVAEAGSNGALISSLQLLTPQYYKSYVEKYGGEDFTWWLATYGGMEQQNHNEFTWYENKPQTIKCD